MTVELSQSDVAILKQALDAWERVVGQEALMGSMLSTMLGCMVEGEDREVYKEKTRHQEEEAKQRADRETQQRRDQATLLRAKLIQASARASEHEEVQHANH